VAAVLALVACAGIPGTGGSPDMISAAKLRQMLPDHALTVIDVRDSRSWRSSAEKIPGAVREDPRAISKWRSKYEHSNSIVLYCA
jgi:rhodanese-related sulfurtransferase